MKTIFSTAVNLPTNMANDIRYCPLSCLCFKHQAIKAVCTNTTCTCSQYKTITAMVNGKTG